LRVWLAECPQRTWADDGQAAGGGLGGGFPGMAMQMSRQHNSCAFSVYTEKLLERQWVRDRCLAGEIAAHISCSMPIDQAAIL
jgi:hypothetical protein